MTKRTTSAAVCMFAVFFLFGCGGGGGGGSSSLYTGLTTPAVVTENNAEEITMQAYQTGERSSSAVFVLGVSGEGHAAAGSPQVLALVRLLKEGAERVPAPSGTTVPMNSTAAALPMTVVTFDETVYDGLGGSMTIHLSIDDQTGDFGGTFRFDGWSGDGGGAISGLTHVSGTFDLTGGFFTRIRFSFNPITMDDGMISASIYGTVDLQSDGFASSSATMNLFLRDNGTLETVWISNYAMDMAEGPDNDFDGEPDYVDTTVSGKVYLPDHGYVVVSTPTPFRYYAGFPLPASGVLLVTGSEGRSARLVVIDAVPESPGYFVEGDLDADSVYEWTGIVHPWM